MEKTSFELDKEEAALIFKKDMSVEIILPKMEDDDTVDFEENQNIFVAMAVASVTDKPDFREIISERLEEMLGSAEPAETCEPAGCAGCAASCDVVEEPVEVPKCTCGAEDCSCEDC